MIYFLLLTSITVSIDSFICGFSLSYNSKKTLPIILGISLTVFLFCLITNYTACFLTGILDEKISGIGGIILIGVGAFNLTKHGGENEKEESGILKQSVITGIGVGTDGAVANFSLSLMGINAFYVPVTIAVCHAVMIAMGILLSKTKIAKKAGKINFLPPLILIALGVYKTLSIFL